MIEMGAYYPVLVSIVPAIRYKNIEKQTMKKKNPFRIASYVLNAHELKQLPADEGIEVAIAGSFKCW